MKENHFSKNMCCFYDIQGPLCATQLRSQPDSFIDFHRAAVLAQHCSQCAAVLLTLLVLKVSESSPSSSHISTLVPWFPPSVKCLHCPVPQLLGTLRFARRSVVLGRVLQRAWRELWALTALLLLLLLLCTHLGNVVR